MWHHIISHGIYFDNGGLMIDYQFILQIRFLVCGHRILTKVLKFKKLCSTKLQKEVDNFKIARDGIISSVSALSMAW